MKTHFERLFRYCAWADRRTIAALRAAPEAHAAALPLLAHVLAAEHVWLSRLAGRAPRHAVWPTLDLSACEALAAENEAGFAAYFASLDPDRLGAVVAYRTSQGTEFATPVVDILTQVSHHGPHHRGQIAAIIKRAGGAPASTDFITFARESASASGPTGK